jgi:hypothetical protein
VKNSFRTLAVAALLPAAALAACDRSPIEPHDHHELGHVVILDRSTTPHTPIATWNHASGWDRTELVTISHATEATRTRVSLGVQMFTRGGQQIQLSSTGEYSARYEVVSDPANVVDMGVAASLFHGDHVHIYGFHQEGRIGSADISFLLWHGSHDDGETSPIRITFTD